jgi:murein DD-endopeptidase MepM/ murein hydrolase activator NlpD
MNSEQIVNRITDLIKFSGISDTHLVEELTDHYLSHIEAEVKRGVNVQQAIRETYQEIAHLDAAQFKVDQNSKHRYGLLLFITLLVCIAFYLMDKNNRSTQNVEATPKKENIAMLNPPSGAPIKETNLKVSSEFGLRLHPIGKAKELHTGIDIRAKKGTLVFSAGDGIVQQTGYNAKAGNFITIQHEGNFLTKYYHLSEIDVTTNQRVKEGQEIGKVGNSGLSFMPHLHYEVLKDAQPVNPREYIRP